ncbi:HMG (high mobility group) box domain containing protein [Acanthamoeba castellanii str. Neff]|uniref:HMG (High mobility group) box domain containing protein n=1 Tax=Acanthamoeba castellanii (strain ATCC 30010 / Neff) TaxID=1257118 RepID=L8GH60_ACACF|nr:HMG (high mobility group) box domain containing protein [Acanthamoeba castellanii str. Neff]ELR12159.1 HMG (high mobility group) box domain containing protein [Acanthamoeba castellanii str. Neff]
MNHDQLPAATATTSPAVLPQPVKAMTAFHLWRKDNEDHYRTANPWVGGTELSALLALGWRRLDATTKKRYEEQAEADQQRFDREWAYYNARLQRMTHTEPTPIQH